MWQIWRGSYLTHRTLWKNIIFSDFSSYLGKLQERDTITRPITALDPPIVIQDFGTRSVTQTIFDLQLFKTKTISQSSKLTIWNLRIPNILRFCLINGLNNWVSKLLLMLMWDRGERQMEGQSQWGTEEERKRGGQWWVWFSCVNSSALAGVSHHHAKHQWFMGYLEMAGLLNVHNPSHAAERERKARDIGGRYLGCGSFLTQPVRAKGENG